MRPSDRRFRDPVVLGIDPGGKWTGLVVRDGDTLLAAGTVQRDAHDTARDLAGAGPAYLDEVLTVARRYATAADLVAIEGVHKPNPHVRGGRTRASNVIDPGPIIATAVLVGHLRAAFPDATIVPPGRNGSGLLLTYPPALVSDPERRHGLHRTGDQGKLRHVRSAWDVAGVAALHARLQAGKPA